MATIREITYALLDMVNGGLPTDDSKINYRVAEIYAKSGVAFTLRKRWFEEKNSSDENYIGKSVSKEQEVKYDNEDDSYYIGTLGESLDMGGMRSFSISSKKRNSRWSLKFVPVTSSEYFNQKGLCNIPNVIQYYLDGDKLRFTNGSVEGIESVMLSQSNLLPSDPDDSVPDDIVDESLNRAYRLAYAEIVINSDRLNDGVAQN